MRTIIAGPRSITNPWLLDDALTRCPWTHQITRVVCGMARGVDMLGRTWALHKRIPVDEHPVTPREWEMIGRRAGYLRNERMADVADAVLAVWDGQSRGTKHMIDIARKRGLVVFVHQV